MFNKKKQQGNVVLWVIFLVIIVGVLAAAVMYGDNQTSEEVGQVSTEAAQEILAVRATDHTKGNTEADITIVEYSDFQCPACRNVLPLFEQILEDYGDNVTFVYRHLPLRTIHPNAQLAAQAAEAAGKQGEFFAMHDILFERQSEWSNERNPRNTFVEYATELELDLDLFAEDLTASESRQRVNADYNDAVTLLGGPNRLSTPSVFLNGQRVENAQFGQLGTMIESLLSAEQEMDDVDVDNTDEV